MGPQAGDVPAEHGEEGRRVIEQASSVQVTMRTLHSNRSMPGLIARPPAAGRARRPLGALRLGVAAIMHHRRPPTPPRAPPRGGGWRTWLARRSAGASPSSMASASTTKSACWPTAARHRPARGLRAAGHRGAPHRLGHAHVALLARPGAGRIRAGAVPRRHRRWHGCRSRCPRRHARPAGRTGRRRGWLQCWGTGRSRRRGGGLFALGVVEMGGVHEAPARSTGA